MAFTVRQQTTYWGVFTALFFAVMWLLGDVILPFVVGGAIAYFLDPVADRLETWGLSRAASSAIIAVVAVFAFVIAALVLVPILIAQTVELGHEIPRLLSQAQAYLNQQFPDLVDPNSAVRKSLDEFGEMVRQNAGVLVEQVFSSAMGVVSAVVFIVVTPVVAFYLLLDWDEMIARIDELVPRDHQPTVRRLAGEVDAVISGFVRGQLSVCLILGGFYAVALMLVGLKFGLVVGVIAGLLTFIPYVGSLVGGALSIGLAVFQFWDQPVWIAVVAGIFAVGQMIEGNVLTPKLVGGSVGLHPVWLLFALSAFGTLFGFVGMLVAVPVSAVIGVLVRFLVREYKTGRLYWGLSTRDDE